MFILTHHSRLTYRAAALSSSLVTRDQEEVRSVTTNACEMNSPSRGERIDAPLPQSGLQSRLFDFRPASTAEGCGLRLVLAGCSPRSSWSCASTASVTALICLGFACRVSLWRERANLAERRIRFAALLPPRIAACTARTQYDCFSWLSNSKVSKYNFSKFLIKMIIYK